VAGSPDIVRELTQPPSPRSPLLLNHPRRFGAPITTPPFELLLFERRLQYQLPTAAPACVRLDLQSLVLDPGHSIVPPCSAPAISVALTHDLPPTQRVHPLPA